MDTETANIVMGVTTSHFCVRRATTLHFESKLRLEKSFKAQTRCSIFVIDFYRGADKSLARPRMKQLFLSEWREFPSAPCLAGKES